jgi:hypothetical protein
MISHEFFLDVAHEETVLWLVRRNPSELLAVADRQRLHRPPGLVVAARRVAELALPLQVIERAQHLLQHCLHIDMVSVVEVDVIGSVAVKAALNRVHDMQRDMPHSFRPGPVGLKTFVAITASRGRVSSARRSMGSDSPLL